MKIKILLPIFFFSVFLAGCSIGSREDEYDNYFITYLTGLTDIDSLNNDYPRSYTIWVEEETILVNYLDGAGGQPDPQEFDLDYFEIDDEGLSFLYDVEEVYLNKLSDSVYEDKNGVRFQLEVLEEE